MHDKIELTIASRFEYLELVGSVTKQVTEMLGFDEDTANWLELSIRESVINAIKHGNGMDAERPVWIEYALGDAEMAVSVRDHGAGFDYAHLPDPLDPENLLNPNGRGIFYMKTFMDEVEFTTPEGGGTLVRMVKRRSNADEKGD